MLSKKSKYAIHALVSLAKNYNNGYLLINQIAEKENIPKKFLETILLDLKNNGFLSSKRGKNGGYYLIKNPDDVNLADIIRIFDGAIGLLPCVTFKYYEKCTECNDEESCGLRSVLKDVRDATVELLKQSTLSEIINREKQFNEKI